MVFKEDGGFRIFHGVNVIAQNFLDFEMHLGFDSFAALPLGGEGATQIFADSSIIRVIDINF